MECDNTTSREELLQKVMEYKFAVNDMALYLDTHPCNEQALKCHNEFVSKFKKAKEEYEEKYGPLCIETEVDSWEKWVYDKWPWEREVR